MKLTTLCYLERDGKMLLLFRNKKEQDPNEGKWIGVGGKFLPGETADACVCREVLEETGLVLKEKHFYGIIHFRNDEWEDEEMYLYSSSDFEGSLREDCDEGELRWVLKEEILSLPAWEGDRYFLECLLRGDEEIELTLNYEKGDLVSVTDRQGNRLK